MPKQIRVLVVDDEAGILNEIRYALTSLTDYAVHVVPSSVDAIKLCAQESFDVLITDVRMPHMDGDNMFAEIKKILPGIRCIVMTAFAGDNAPVNFLKLGAHDFLYKPFVSRDIISSIDNQVQIIKLRWQADELQRQLMTFHTAIQEIMSSVQSVAQLSRAPELLMALNNFTDLATTLCGAPAATIFLFEADGRGLSPRCMVGLDGSFPAIPIGKGIAGRTAQAGCMNVFARDVGGTWPGDEISGSIEMNRSSVLSVPLIARSICIGVLEVFDKPRFEQRDMEMITQLGVIASANLDLFNATQMADNLLLHALKLATDAEQVGSQQASDAARKALCGMAETIRDIDLVGSGKRASSIVEQIRQFTAYGPAAEECAENLLSNVLAMLRLQHGEQC